MSLTFTVYFSHISTQFTCTYTLISTIYIYKSQTEFNIRLNNHRKDVKAPNAIPTCKHFHHNHIFNNDAKFILIEKLDIQNASQELRIKRLKEREDFWILELKTLIPHGLNHELNYPLN